MPTMMRQALLLLSMVMPTTSVTTKEAKKEIIAILDQLHGNRGVRWLHQGLPVGGNTWFFNTDDGVHGAELWASDLTPLGTRLVADIQPGAEDGYPTYIVDFAGALYFSADDGSHGVELFRTDGSAAGTELFVDVNPGAESSYAAELTACGGNLFFAAEDAAHVFEMRVSDGTAAGTKLLRDITAGPESSSLSKVECKEEKLHFWVGAAHPGSQWVSDGTVDGTAMLAEAQGKAEL